MDGVGVIIGFERVQLLLVEAVVKVVMPGGSGHLGSVLGGALAGLGHEVVVLTRGEPDTELLLESRRVVPGRLLDAGFTFTYPRWPEAASELAHRRP